MLSTTPTTSMDIPTEFICPITMEIMDHPLMSRYGQNYERSAIIAWIAQRGNEDCPLTRQPLKMSDLIHNKILSRKIERWREANNFPAPTTCYSGEDNNHGIEYNNNADCSDVLHNIYGSGKIPFKGVVVSKHLFSETSTHHNHGMFQVISLEGNGTNRHHRKFSSLWKRWNKNENGVMAC